MRISTRTAARSRVSAGRYDRPALFRQLPNAITVLRLALLPWFIHAFLQERRTTALAVIVAIALSDWLDGWLARRFKNVTPLGTLLDPIADKLVQFAAMFLLVRSGDLPAWFLGLVLGRDLMLLYGALRIRRRHKRVVIHARLEGKLSTLFVFGSIIAALAGAPPIVLNTCVGAGAACVVASALRYLHAGKRQYRGEQP